MTETNASRPLDPELVSILIANDAADRELIANVHPLDWTNPEPAPRYNLVVIGGGTAGLVSAAAAAGLGARVALIERRLLGGDCLNHGCVPSKALISAAREWKRASDVGAASGAPPVATPGDFGRVMARMRQLRAEISHHDSAARFRDLGVDVFIGEGRFSAPDEVSVGNSQLRFRKAIVATGARPTTPPIPGLEAAGYLTNETIFTLEELPRRLAVIGAGPIGCELAQSFARFGSQVTVIDIAPHVLPREDLEAAAIVRDSLASDGVQFALEATVENVARHGNEITLQIARDGTTVTQTFDRLLLAVGRKPNVDGIGLDQASVEYSPSGVSVDDRLRTSNRRIYAVGDVASQYKFTHVADALARIAIQNALFFGRKKASDLVVPWCTYTDPEVAHVGLTWDEARRQGKRVDSLTIPLADVDRAKLEGTRDGFLRLYVNKGSDRILGATVVAPHAGDLLGELCLAVTHGVGLAKISSTIHPYPTLGEIARKAGDAWMRGRLTPRVLGAFRRYFSFMR